MLLAIDIGNTNITLGVFDDENLVAEWRLNSDRTRTSDEFGAIIRQMFTASEIDHNRISVVIIASVVPVLNFPFQRMTEKYFGLTAMFIDGSLDLGLKILYDSSADVGADRIVDAVAAVELYGAPCVVADLGTATTIDGINSKREYLGGIIAPGLNTFSDALFQRATKLPRVEIRKPEKVFGASTVSSIQSGLYYGYVGLIDGILRRMISEIGDHPKIIATGGYASLISQDSEFIETVDDTLILKGLRLIHQKISCK